MRLIRFAGWLSVVVAWSLGYGCAHQPTPTRPQPAAVCTIDPGPAPGSCGALYDPEGRACVVCADDQGCVDPGADVYCVGSSACDDPVCGPRAARRK